jgi:rsbT co-antagonist protein RsbR
MENDDLRRAGAVLAAHEAAVLPAWAQAAASRLRGRMTAQELGSELRALYASLVQASRDATDGALDETRAVLSELSRSQARQGFSPTETASTVTSLKQLLVPLLRDGRLSIDDMLAVNAVVDELALFTFETYVTVREQVIVDQTEQLLELSTPVIKLWQGIVAVPLVGTLDSARTQLVMENLLQTLVDTGSEHAIIDITGVPAVDTQVAQHLLKTVFAARLMGAECIVSGIRPQIAQTIVALGIEFGDITTKATLADALAACLRSRGVEVTVRGERKV